MTRTRRLLLNCVFLLVSVLGSAVAMNVVPVPGDGAPRTPSRAVGVVVFVGCFTLLSGLHWYRRRRTVESAG